MVSSSTDSLPLYLTCGGERDGPREGNRLTRRPGYLTFIWGKSEDRGKRSDGIQSCGSGDGARKACLLFSCNDCNRRSKLTVGVSAAGGVDSVAPICVAYGRFALLCESVGARLGELPVTFRGSATMSPCFPCSLSISALHNTHSLCRAGVCVATTHSRVQEFRTCIYLENKMGQWGLCKFIW